MTASERLTICNSNPNFQEPRPWPSRPDDHRRNDQRFGPLDEEALRRRRHRRPAGAGPLPGRERGGLHRRERRPAPPEFMAEMVRKIQGVTAKPLSIDTPDPEIARAGLAAYDPAPGRRPEADPQFDHVAAGRDVRPVRDPALPADPAGFRARGRRPVAALPHRRGDLRGGPGTWSRRFLERCPGAANDDCIIDPGIAPHRQRLRREPQAADRGRWS